MCETFHLEKHLGWADLGSSGTRILAPGVTGDLLWRTPTEHAPYMASASPRPSVATAPDLVETALKEAGLVDRGSFNLPAGAGSVAAEPNSIVLSRSLAPNEIEFAIYRDESGVISLHRPWPSAPSPTAMSVTPGKPSDGRSVHYVIPLRHAPTPTGGVPEMAMLGGIVGKVIRFVGRAASGVIGDAVYAAAKLWEDHYRASQGFHQGSTTAQLLSSTPVTLAPADFQALQVGKSLLFIHGTISSTAGAFTGLQGFTAEAGNLYTKYGNRVIGFNHHTLTKSVPQNALDFLSSLPAGNYDFDVISHSRGGLLARALKELTSVELGQLMDAGWSPPAGLNLRIDKVVLVGTPNVGTPLANPADLPEAVSRLASIASSFSQTVAAIGLGALFAIFGGIVEGGVGALPGLEDMDPGSPFLTRVNVASTDNSSYYGIEADFEPTGGLAQAIESNGIDALFQSEANDLVVPTLGVSQVNGQTLAQTQVDAYSRNANVYHTDYFYQQGTWDAILRFLT